MHFENYEYRSDHMRRAFGEGRHQGQLECARAIVLTLVDGHGAVRDDLRARVEACDDPELLRTLATDVARAADRSAVELLLTRLSAKVVDA